MVHILQNRPLADHRMAGMFADRKRLFVDLLGWDVPVVDNRFEIDNFDGADATYLIATDIAGDHIGSLRLLPTTRRHILGDLFPDLCVGMPPAGPGVMEVTRLCLPCRLGAVRRLAVRNRLISAMVDHALASGVTTLTGVVTRGFLEQVLAMGWTCAPLGQVRRHGKDWLGAFRIELDASTVPGLIRTGIYTAGTIAVPQALAA